MRSDIVTYQENPRTDCTSVGSKISLRISSLYHAPVRLSTCRSVRHSMEMPLQAITDSPSSLSCWTMIFSRPLRIRWIHLSWTDFHLWKAQSAIGELANSGVFWQTPSRLHDDVVWGSSQKMDIETLTHCCGVGFWQVGHKSEPQATLQVTLYGKDSASPESPSRQSEIPGGRLNKKDGLTRYGDSHVKDKTS